MTLELILDLVPWLLAMGLIGYILKLKLDLVRQERKMLEDRVRDLDHPRVHAQVPQTTYPKYGTGDYPENNWPE